MCAEYNRFATYPKHKDGPSLVAVNVAESPPENFGCDKGFVPAGSPDLKSRTHLAHSTRHIGWSLAPSKERSG